MAINNDEYLSMSMKEVRLPIPLYIIQYMKYATPKHRWTSWTEDMEEDMEHCGGYIP